MVHLHDAHPEVIRKALEEKIAQAPAFLKNAPVVVNVAGLDGSINWQQLHQTFIDSGLHLVGISGCQDDALKAEISRAGLALLTEGKASAPRAAKPAEAPVPPAPTAALRTRLIDLPVRSGQRIYAPGADLVVTSHVSAGAELIADGNIHVYGTMRGRALAGASGDKEAQIFSTNLAAELVSIAGVYWLSDQIPAEFYNKAARLRLADGALTVQPLN
ncbi:minC protein [Cronobacter malonaticus]|uniref:Probable septum site-determining protein MinC n=1 Tax=Cronobacter malonaticus TaxID=413503 RepID=V5TZD2_9ENTR|nr:minC protein [Cronobacter malonaticus]